MEIPVITNLKFHRKIPYRYYSIIQQGPNKKIRLRCQSASPTDPTPPPVVTFNAVVVHGEYGIVEHVPDDEPPVVGHRQQDVGLRGVGLQHIHLVLPHNKNQL